MDKLYLNISGAHDEIAILKDYFNAQYTDIEIKEMTYTGLMLNESTIVTLLFLSAIGGGAGIKAIYDIISSINKKHNKTVRISGDGEFMVENMSVQEFLKLYNSLKGKEQGKHHGK